MKDLIKRKSYLIAMLLILFSEATMAQSGSWSNLLYQNSYWGFAYPTQTDFRIRSQSDLARFAYLVNQGDDFRNKTVYLDVSLNMDMYFWVPIGTEEHPFRGTFKGGNFTIGGIRMQGNDKYAGLFGHVADGSVEDVQIGSSVIAGEGYVGAIAGCVENARISGCSLLKDVEIQGTGCAACYPLFL